MERHSVVTKEDQAVENEDDADDVNSKDVTVAVDQEFDSGTVKRRHKPSGDDSRQLTDSVTTDVDRW